MTVPASTSRPRTPWGGVSVQTNGRGSASLASQKVAERTHQPEIIAFGRYEAWDWPVCMVNFDPTHFGSVVGVPKWEMSGKGWESREKMDALNIGTEKIVRFLEFNRYHFVEREDWASIEWKVMYALVFTGVAISVLGAFFSNIPSFGIGLAVILLSSIVGARIYIQGKFDYLGPADRH